MLSKLPLEALDLKMIIDDSIRSEMESDLGLNIPFIKGQNTPVRNCWHFSTNGNLVDFMFRDDSDFVAGTNRIFVLAKKHRVVVLAYNLMNTHVHFVLWGEYWECVRFIYEYLKLTSMYIEAKYDEKHKLEEVYPDHQPIDNDWYLKVCICYVIKNAPVGGLPFNAQDYPWSSGALYFRRKGSWTFSGWESLMTDSQELSDNEIRRRLKSKQLPSEPFKLIGDMVFPGEFVAVEIVERLFYSHKGFNYFMGISKESDVESVKGAISRLSIPHSELHQHKNELCLEKFGVKTIRSLTTTQRLALAKTLRSLYNCSPKQVAKSCGLIYEEVKSML